MEGEGNWREGGSGMTLASFSGVLFGCGRFEGRREGGMSDNEGREKPNGRKREKKENH